MEPLPPPRMVDVSSKHIIILLCELKCFKFRFQSFWSRSSFTEAGYVAQIAILDIVFSLDSVITAVGMAEDLSVMVAAVVISVVVMMLFAERVSRFVKRHPTLKVLALSFLILIGVMLVAEAIGTEVNKGYIYFAMAFSLVVEMINIRLRRRGVES